MKSQSDFKLDQSLALLLIGNPGAGKTNLAAEFPNPYFIDWGDANLKSALERHPGKTIYWDSVLTDDQGKEVPPEKRWLRGAQLLKENLPKPEIQTIVDDSLSMMQCALQDHIVSQSEHVERPQVIAGVKVMSRSHWSAYRELMLRRVMGIRAYGKPYIVTCHMKIDADEVTGSKIYLPNISGYWKDHLASIFTDFWECRTEQTSDTKRYPTGVKYYVRTAPTSRIELKCSYGLPANFEFTWEAFQDHMAKRRAA